MNYHVGFQLSVQAALPWPIDQLLHVDVMATVFQQVYWIFQQPVFQLPAMTFASLRSVLLELPAFYHQYALLQIQYEAPFQQLVFQTQPWCESETLSGCPQLPDYRDRPLL